MCSFSLLLHPNTPDKKTNKHAKTQQTICIVYNTCKTQFLPRAAPGFGRGGVLAHGRVATVPTGQRKAVQSSGRLVLVALMVPGTMGRGTSENVAAPSESLSAVLGCLIRSGGWSLCLV